jgi:hypothetical protein
MDWTGTALATADVTAVVLPLVQGRQYGWPWWSLASLGGARDPGRVLGLPDPRSPRPAGAGRAGAR